MSEHDCKDGCHGSYKPQRKIVVPKAKFPMIIDERMRKNVNLKGILELGSLLYKNEYLFSEDMNFADEFCKAMKEFPECRANLVCAINSDATEFSVFSCFKGKVTVSATNYVIDKDILNSFKNNEAITDFCDILDANNLSFVPVSVTDMLILKSIAGVQPYDMLLAKHYISQYVSAKNALSSDDLDLLVRVKEEGLPTLDESYNDAVKLFLRIERKLYSQYAH
jgi:hypothetical protein